MKKRDLLNYKECGMKYYYNSISNGAKGSSYYISVAMKEVLVMLLQKRIKANEVKDRLDVLIGDSVLNISKPDILEELERNIIRYFDYVEKNFNILSYGGVEEVTIGKTPVSVSYDLILENTEGVRVVKLTRSKPKLSYRARTVDSMPKHNVDLFLMKSVGAKLYPNKKTFGAFHHLKAKKDDELLKKASKVNPYDFKKGENIVEWDFVGNEYDDIERLCEGLIQGIESQTYLKEECSDCKECNFFHMCFYEKSIASEKLEQLEEVKKADREVKLTKAQLKAVAFRKGVTRINAGAGSGKTTVVALRVADLILEGCNPEDILLVTFTNKGAKEMKEKIEYWLSKEEIKFDEEKFNITTFNSWGDSIIKDNYKELGFTGEPMLIEKVQIYDIIMDILGNYPKLEGFDYKNPLMAFKHAKGIVPLVKEIFDYMKAYHVFDIKKIREAFNNEFIPSAIVKMQKDYVERLKELNLIEYQDQISLVFDLVDQDSECLDKYNYKHLIIDEFQDSDALQIDLIHYLVNKDKFESLMVVGDDSQSIFGFRNTSQENILNFHKMFNSVEDIKMVENFRSTKAIIDLANKINNLNKNKIKKELKTSSEQGQTPQLILTEKGTELEFIAKKIKEKIEGGENPEDIAVITRTKSELLNLSHFLIEEKVPFIMDVPEQLLNNPNLHIMNDLIDFIGDTNNTAGLLKFLFAIEAFSEGEKNIEKILEEEVNLYQEILEEGKENLDEVKKDLFLTSMDFVDDLDIREFTKEIEAKNIPFVEIKKYINKFIIYQDQKTISRDEKKYRAVTLTTAHTSKGKEFKIVYNSISKYNGGNTDKSIEEERRLLFVSITRAKKELYLTVEDRGAKTIIKGYNKYAEEIIETGLVNRRIAKKTFVSC